MKFLVTSAFVLPLVFLASSAISAEGPDLAKALAGADWLKTETVTITITEYAFSPSPIVLKEGVPTRLVLKNAGKEAHYFVAEQFFKGMLDEENPGFRRRDQGPLLHGVGGLPGQDAGVVPGARTEGGIRPPLHSQGTRRARNEREDRGALIGDALRRAAVRGNSHAVRGIHENQITGGEGGAFHTAIAGHRSRTEKAGRPPPFPHLFF